MKEFYTETCARNFSTKTHLSRRISLDFVSVIELLYFKEKKKFGYLIVTLDMLIYLYSSWLFFNGINDVEIKTIDTFDILFVEVLMLLDFSVITRYN